jgi:hypothetical protein
VDLHELAERRSLAIHSEIARRLVDDPSLLEHARAVLQKWREEKLIATYYADEWERRFEGPLADLARFLASDAEDARALRQASPFVGIVSPRERWKIWRDVRAESGR